MGGGEREQRKLSFARKHCRHDINKNGRGMKSRKTDDEIREEMAKHGWHNEYGERADSMISRLIDLASRQRTFAARQSGRNRESVGK